MFCRSAWPEVVTQVSGLCADDIERLGRAHERLDSQVAILERTSGNDQASRGVRQAAQHIRRLITIIENLVSELESESM